jgi:signal peptidase I
MAELKVGDIIIYKHPTKTIDNIAHRIIEVGTGDRENQFKTRGDNSAEVYWVPSRNIHGLVIGVIYKTGLE